MKIVKISSGGQISIPAEIRKRWGTKSVFFEDCDDHMIVRPSPDDPVAAVRGVFKGLLDERASEVMRKYKEEERRIEQQKFDRLYGLKDDNS